MTSESCLEKKVFLPGTVSRGRATESVACRRWYAVYTSPQHEKAASRSLGVREVDHFLPTYTQQRAWKNRQRVRTEFPLFPGYLFVRIGDGERARVLSTPGVVRILGTPRAPAPVPDSIIDFLRSDLCRDRLEPYPHFAVGQKVRIKNGPMREVTGVLVRRKNDFRFVVSVELINQHASLEVRGEDLDLILA